MKDKDIDFGDLISAVVEKNAAMTKAKAEAERATKKAANDLRLEACRPLLTVFRQAKERFPRLGIHNIDVHGDPHVYTDGNIWVTLEFKPSPRLFSLVRRCSGFGFSHSPEVIISSEFAEDLIPPLVEILARATTRR